MFLRADRKVVLEKEREAPRPRKPTQSNRVLGSNRSGIAFHASNFKIIQLLSVLEKDDRHRFANMKVRLPVSRFLARREMNQSEESEEEMT
jgi:hypothetical protein